MILEATGPGGAVATFVVTAQDLVSGVVTPNCSPASSGSTFPIDTTTVTCSATGALGNTGRATLTVTVVDRTPPVVTVPPNNTEEATGPGGAVVTFSASATDLVDGAVPVTCTPPSGSTFPIGDTTVTCTTRDSAGNDASGSFTVTVRDSTAPVITYTGNASVYSVGDTIDIRCSATDSGSGIASTTCRDITGPAYTFALGSNTFSGTAIDNAGNTGTGSVMFTVQVTAAGMRALIQQFVTNPGIAKALLAKLDAVETAAARGNAAAKAGALRAFQNEVEAHRGKALTNEQADILLRLSGGL